VTRAGALAAEWSVASLAASRRRFIGWLPRPFRYRAALRVAAATMRAVSRESRCARRVRGTSAEVRLTGSVFCAVRAPQLTPLCGFYAALVVRTLALFDIRATARLERCRATGAPACVLLVDLSGTEAEAPPAIAA
jgi:hypothetical protein